MRPLLYILSFLAVMGLGFWAYRENYATQASLREVAVLQDEIAQLREALTIQQAEWAYLNRPSRLRELANLNYKRLGIAPMSAEQFGVAQSVAYPPAPTAADLVVDNPLDVAASIAGPLDGDVENAAPAEIVASGEEQTP